MVPRDVEDQIVALATLSEVLLSVVDDLVCAALFIDPVGRLEDRFGWIVRLRKRDHLRGGSDLSVVRREGMFNYVLRPVS